MENKIVVKQNTLVPAFAKMGHQEKRFLAYCIAQLNPVHEKEFSRFKVRISEIAEVFGLSETATYSRIIDAAISVNSHPVTSKSRRIIDFWFVRLDAETYPGEIEVEFNHHLVPYLLDLKREYMQYPLSVVAGLSNKGWSLYEILKQWLPLKEKTFTLDEIKDALGLVGKYPKWGDFKRYGIAPAVKEINEKSDIEVFYEKEKEGRRVSGLIFHIDKRQPDNVIELQSNQDKLYKALLSHGINHKTALDYAQKCESKDCTKVILKKLLEIVKRAEKTAMSTTVGKKKSAVIRYILGAIKNELNQGQLFPHQKFNEKVPVGFTVVTREDAEMLAYPHESWSECIARLKKSRIIVR